MSELSELPNTTPEQLRETESEKTFIRIRAKVPDAYIRMLYSVLELIRRIKYFYAPI